MGFWPFGKKKPDRARALSMPPPGAGPAPSLRPVKRNPFADPDETPTHNVRARLYREKDVPRATSPPVAVPSRPPPPAYSSTRPLQSHPPSLPPPPHAQPQPSQSPPTQGPLPPLLFQRRAQGSAEDITALPLATELERSPHLRPVPDRQLSDYRREMEAASLPNPAVPLYQASASLYGGTRSPVERSKKSFDNPSLFRRRSSRRDPVREQQIKAMSQTLPPTAEDEAGVERQPSRRGRQRADDDAGPITLRPTPSVRSSMTDHVQHSRRQFKMGAIDMLSPHPMLRPSASDHFHTTAHPQLAPPSRVSASRPPSAKDKWPVRSPGDRLRQRKTVDVLADDLDATSIRVAMERDQKRREQKLRESEARLERRRDKQRSVGQHPPLPSASSPPDFVGTEASMATSAEPMRPRVDQTAELLQPPPNPFADTETASQRSGYSGGGSIIGEPVISTAQAVRMSQASLTPPSSPTHKHQRNISSISSPSNLQVLSESEAAATTEDAAATAGARESRRDSDQSGPRVSAWSSIFKRRAKSPPPDPAPALDTPESQPRESISGANVPPTSGEPISRQSLPASVRAEGERLPGSTNSPLRSQSIFYEDLPPSQLTPSAIQPARDGQKGDGEDTAALVPPPRSERRLTPTAPVGISRTAVPPAPSSDDVTPTESPIGSGSVGVGVPLGPGRVIAHSLASVDSEGSWLSGRSKRMSQQTATGVSLAEQQRSEDRDSTADSSRASDSVITPQLGREPSRHSLSQAQSAQQEVAADADTVKHGTIAQRPTIIEHPQRARSVEGLLRQFDDASDGDGDGDDNSESSSLGSIHDARPAGEDMTLERATSIAYPGHARQVSAGSAKLLDLPPTPKRTEFPRDRESAGGSRPATAASGGGGGMASNVPPPPSSAVDMDKSTKEEEEE